MKVVKFNLCVPFALAREALPHLRKVKGSITFISSDSGDFRIYLSQSPQNIFLKFFLQFV